MLVRACLVALVLGCTLPAFGRSSARRSYVTFEDPRLISGQVAKVGSLYIIDREQLDVRSLVSRARTFRERILRSVFEE